MKIVVVVLCSLRLPLLIQSVPETWLPITQEQLEKFDSS